METSLIIAIISSIGTVVLGVFQLTLWRGQARKANAEAEVLLSAEESKERLDEFTILRELNKELKQYIDDLHSRNESLELKLQSKDELILGLQAVAKDKEEIILQLQARNLTLEKKPTKKPKGDTV